MEYLRFTLCRKIYITTKAIVFDHLFSFVGDVRTHGRQPLQCIEHLLVFGLVFHLTGFAMVGHTLLGE